MRKVSRRAHVPSVFVPKPEGMTKSSGSGRIDGHRSRAAIIRSVFQLLTPHAQRVGRPTTTCTEDPEWAIAMCVPIGPGAVDVDSGILGVVTARKHSTGWFISASHHAGMSHEEIADFRHFVSVRVYLLLYYGPGVDTWAPEGSNGRWRAYLRDQTPHTLGRQVSLG